MVLSDIKIGKSIEIFIDRQGYRYRIVSKIEDVQQDNISVTLIASRDKIFQFTQFDKVEILYRMEERLWKWKKIKGGVKNLEGTKVHNLQLTTNEDEGEIFNRRDAYRVFVGESVDVKYYVLNPEYKEYVKAVEEGKADTSVKVEQYIIHHCEGFIKDISENGVGVFLSVKFELKSELEFSFATEHGNIFCKAEVARITKERHGIFEDYYGCSLNESSKNLLKYIFNMQRIQVINARKAKQYGEREK